MGKQLERNFAARSIQQVGYFLSRNISFRERFVLYFGLKNNEKLVETNDNRSNQIQLQSKIKYINNYTATKTATIKQKR